MGGLCLLSIGPFKEATTGFPSSMFCLLLGGGRGQLLAVIQSFQKLLGYPGWSTAGDQQKGLAGMKAFDVSPTGTWSDGGKPAPFYSEPISAMGPGPITEDVSVGQRRHFLGGPKHGGFLNAPGI